VTYECVARPTCPACGAEWDDEMVALFEMALGIGCACCIPYAVDLPDIVCHKCRKVLYSPREPAAASADTPPGEGLDLTPRA
jgi:hypothetical protein